MKLIFALLFFVIPPGDLVYSQNKIYLQEAVKDGKVTDITPDEIKYTDSSYSSQVNAVPRNKTLLLFNDKGGFLVVYKPGFFNVALSKNLVDNFINYQDNTRTDTDRIFTINKKLLACDIINEDILSFYISLNGVQLKVDKLTVAVVIYKDGSHKLITATETAADVLYTFQSQDKVGSTARSTQKTSITTPAVASKEPVIKSDVKKENNEPMPQDTAKTIEQKQPIIIVEKTAGDTLLAAREIDKQYSLIVGNANALYKRGDYSRAKFFYVRANVLKPDEREPLDGLDSINNKLLAAEKLQADSVEYFATLTIANRLAYLEKWDSALTMYSKAMQIRPQEYYPHKGIIYVQSVIDRLKAEAAQKASEAKFSDAMARANVAVKEQRYEDALADYNEALTIHPDNTYARDRSKILAYQISLKQKVAGQ